jgi:hypothetical protein
MVASSAIGLSLLAMLLAGGAGGLPPVGAPLPLDPVMSAIAPEECLWYSASAGVGPADPASKNETELLFAEPQVQRLMAELEKQITAAVRRAGGPNREQRVVAAQAPKIAKALLSRPVAAYVEDVQPGPNRSVKVEAALVLNAGDGKAELAGAVQELLALAAEQGMKATAESAGGVDWQRLPLPPQMPPVRIGWKDAYLVLAVGEGTPAKLLVRMNGAAPEWLTRIRAEHPIERELTIGYVNVAGILGRVKPLVEQQNPPAWQVVERLGLTSIKALHGVTGFDASGTASLAHIQTDGSRPGLLAFLPHDPLSADDLTLVPKDALVAGAVRLNLGEVVDQAVALASQFNPRMKEDFERHMWEVETNLGVNPREDVVGSLGETWVVYLPGGDLMSSWLNAAAAVRVKDPAKLRSAVAKLVDVAKSEMGRGGEASIATSTVGGATVYSLQFNREPVPFSPSLCVTDDWVVIGLMPAAIQSAVERKAEGSLASSAAVKDALSAKPAPAALMYQDTPALVRSAYPWLQIGVQMISGPLRREGIEIDVTALPAPDTIFKHLRPTIAALASSDDGFHMTARGTLPGGGNMVGAVPVVAALLLPAVAKARESAQQAQEMNNMRQIALAAMNYEAVTGQMPSDVYGADGKPLLSWRVRLLPYLDETALSQQLKMDEPWDSPHNRALLMNIPQVFRSPSAPAAPGLTRILGFKGEGAIFPGNQNLKIRDITDGTSNTVFFVEAAPQAAVEWTKPVDIEFDAARPFAGLAQPSGEFLAAFVDGSVRKLSLGLSPETMKALTTRAGDEPIEYDSLAAPPAPWMYNQLQIQDQTAPTKDPAAEKIPG